MSKLSDLAKKKINEAKNNEDEINENDTKSKDETEKGAEDIAYSEEDILFYAEEGHYPEGAKVLRVQGQVEPTTYNAENLKKHFSGEEFSYFLDYELRERGYERIAEQIAGRHYDRVKYNIDRPMTAECEAFLAKIDAVYSVK